MKDLKLSNKKNIVFVPDAHYLSDPIFFELAEEKSKGYRYIYFDTKFPMSFEQKSIDKEKIKIFDEFVEVDDKMVPTIKDVFNNKNISFRINKILDFLRAYTRYRHELYSQLDKIKPAAIIVTTDKLLVSKELYKYAQRKQIPYIVYQSAFINMNPYPFKRKFKNFIYRILFNLLMQIPLSVKNSLYGNEEKNAYLFLWGDYFKQFYGNLKPEHIKVVGNPYYDKVIMKSIENVERLKGSFPVEQLKILVCTQEMSGLISEQEDNELKRSYRQMVEEHPDHWFCFKIHPRESKDAYEEIFHGLKNVKISDNDDLLSLLKEYNFQISSGSLTSFLSILSGVPVILFKPDLLASTGYFNGRVEQKAQDINEFSVLLKYLNKRSSYIEFLKERESYLETMLRHNACQNFNRVLNENN